MTAETFQNLKKEGDNFYASENFLAAIEKYTKCLQNFPNADSIDLAVIYSNRCACYLQQGVYVTGYLHFKSHTYFLFTSLRERVEGINRC